jgi:hypothetical protein
MRKEVVEWLQVAGWLETECRVQAVRAGVSWNLQMMRVPAGRETREGTDCLSRFSVMADGRSGGCAALEEESPRENLGWLPGCRLVKTGLRVRRTLHAET